MGNKPIVIDADETRCGIRNVPAANRVFDESIKTAFSAKI